VGLAVAALARLARGAPRRAAGHGPRLASAWFSSVLDLEEPTSHGRPGVSADLRALIREMSTMNPLWRTSDPRRTPATVAKYMRRPRRPTSQTWRSFLTNHASQIMAADLFVVPTVTFRLLFVLVILAHDRPDRSRGGHRAPDRCLDGTTASQCLFRERAAAISTPRS
jgi:hypothetical protein